jgi:hypothetical protein
LVSYCIICPSSALPLWYLIVLSVLPKGQDSRRTDNTIRYQRGKAEEGQIMQEDTKGVRQKKDRKYNKISKG